MGGFLLGEFGEQDKDRGPRNVLIVTLAKSEMLHLGRLAVAFGMTDEYLRRLRRKEEAGGLGALLLSKQGKDSTVPPELRAEWCAMFAAGHMPTATSRAQRGAKRTHFSYTTVRREFLTWQQARASRRGATDRSEDGHRIAAERWTTAAVVRGASDEPGRRDRGTRSRSRRRERDAGRRRRGDRADDNRACSRWADGAARRLLDAARARQRVRTSRRRRTRLQAREPGRASDRTGRSDLFARDLSTLHRGCATPRNTNRADAASRGTCADRQRRAKAARSVARRDGVRRCGPRSTDHRASHRSRACGRRPGDLLRGRPHAAVHRQARGAERVAHAGSARPPRLDRLLRARRGWSTGVSRPGDFAR